MISEELIQKIKEQNDIVDVISESVKLKRVGRNFVGICPFHNEKTPSFSVSQDKQIYKCFGCGEAGNVITFVMKTKNMSFIEGVKYLAEKANIELNIQGTNKEQRDKNEKLFKVNVEAARYYFKKLQNEKKVIEYFTLRGILNNTIRKFGLGYAPKGWHNLMNYLKAKGYSELDLLNAGLIVRGKNNSLYDRFRDRVIFPVFDYKGKVIGFGGRVLDNSKPKYLNSPETEIFKKGTNLYGLNFSIKNLKDRTIIIVEGYMDCISLHQYGITNVVASLGTALTSEQAKLLKRYADKIIISYDADLAGRSATIRGLKILRKQGFDLRVLTVPQGKDPDEFIRNNGKEAFMKLINNSLPFIDYRIKMAKYGLDLKNREMVMKYINKACEIISELDPVEMDLYIRKLSEETGINEQAIYDSLTTKNQKNVKKSQHTYTENDFGQKLYLEPAYMKAERNLLKIMLQDMDSYRYIIENFNKEDFILDSHKKIFSLIGESIENNIENIEKHIEAKCDDVESSKEWIKVQQIEFIDDDYKELINDYIREIKKFKLEESKKEIMKKIKHYEAKGFFEESLKLVKQLQKIQADIMQMNNNERR
ncbi:DNA primase [Clostridium ganghwense]|uniref:DNA primase n=1 Tax=Clostridium ganghwense TaxID=312089 RepID=A0ABT4CV25_9CLOT|nr:DNA primase [Clostridium ganghwense]MCY6371804.1 DNA primase [Clostridium ganghwense]